MKKLINRLNFRQDFPFDVRQSGIFYGWIILVAGAFGVLMSLPGQTTGISVFTDHLITHYRLDRLWITVAYLIGTVASGFMVRRVGKYYDILGVRPIAIIARIILALTLLLLSQLDRIVASLAFLNSGQFSRYLLFSLLVPLFFLLRLSGQGVTTMISRNMVMKWFEIRRGFANIFLGAMITIGFNITPLLFNGLIELSGWRKAWTGMAVFLLTAYMAIIIVFFRDNPQSCGLQPDGQKKRPKEDKKVSVFRSNGEFTLSQARRTREFWLYSSSIALLGLFFTGFTFNFESIFEQMGMPKETGIRIFALAGFVSLAFQIAGNYLSDFYSLRYYLPAATFTTMLNIACVPFISDGNAFYYLFILLLSLNSAFFAIFSAITWPRLFGTRHLGEISGLSIGIVVISSGLGPLLMASSLRFLGSYRPSFYLCAAAGLILFLLSFSVRDERRLPRT